MSLDLDAEDRDCQARIMARSAPAPSSEVPDRLDLPDWGVATNRTSTRQLDPDLDLDPDPDRKGEQPMKEWFRTSRNELVHLKHVTLISLKEYTIKFYLVGRDEPAVHNPASPSKDCSYSQAVERAQAFYNTFFASLEARE